MKGNNLVKRQPAGWEKICYLHISQETEVQNTGETQTLKSKKTNNPLNKWVDNFKESWNIHELKQAKDYAFSLSEWQKFRKQ